MSKPFFSSQGSVEKLQSVAASWVGTPWAQNSRVKGAGACCHYLPYEVLTESGFPMAFDPPTAPPTYSMHNSESLMAPYMDARGEFESVSKTELQPGDIIGFVVGKCVHHLGMVLPGGKFIHVIRHSGTVVSSLSDPTFSKRLERAWRPVV